MSQAMVVAGRYSLEATLDRGRSGMVYRARDQATGAAVAVKHLVFDLQQHAQGPERFRAEVALLRRIEHPDVVRVLDAVVDGTEAWLVTELVAGTSLRQVLRSAGRLTPEQAFGVLAGCLSGVAAAHEAGVVHGDLKPENILVDAATSTSKLVDFGQARLHGAPKGTAGGVPSSGTPGYQAPEVLAGATPGPASDVYALGVVLFECLAGEPPYRAPSAERVALMHAEDPVPPVLGVAPAVSDLVATALAKDPAARPAAGALLARLEQVAEEAYGANWRTRASLGALTAVLGAEGAAIATAATAGAPEAAAVRPQVSRGTDRAGAQAAALRRSSRARALQTIAAHKAVTAVVAGIVVLGAVGGLFATRASGSPAPATSTQAVATARTTTTTVTRRTTSPTTTASTTTTTTPVPAPTPIAVSPCQTQFGVPPSSIPAVPTSETATVTPAEASALSFYTDQLGRLLILAPKEWTCSALDSMDGTASLAVYPPGTAAPQDRLDSPWQGVAASPSDEQAVTALEYPGITEASSSACPLFATAQSTSIDNTTCGTPPPGEQTIPVGATEVRFTDPANVTGDGDPSGGSNTANGVMLFNPSSTYNPPFYQATCTLGAQYQSLCNPAITDFTTRYSGS